MGQKVNPISMRLQVNKQWRSKWFAGKKEYATFLKQDLAVRREIEKKFETRAVIDRIDIERSPNLVTVTIHTSKAGVVIGRGGVGAQEIKTLCEKILKLPFALILKKLNDQNFLQNLLLKTLLVS